MLLTLCWWPSCSSSWVCRICLFKKFRNLCAGIPWILDVVSAAVAHSAGKSETVWRRLLLDIVNLLQVKLILYAKFTMICSGCFHFPDTCVQEKYFYEDEK